MSHLRGDARKRGTAQTNALLTDVEAVAETLSWADGEFTRWSPDAHPDHNRWSWRGDGHGEPTASNPLRDHFREAARTILASDWLATDRAESRAAVLTAAADDLNRHAHTFTDTLTKDDYAAADIALRQIGIDLGAIIAAAWHLALLDAAGRVREAAIHEAAKESQR